MDRTAHTTSAMLNRYRRAARSASELGLGSLPPLLHAIPESPQFLNRVGQGWPEKPETAGKKQRKKAKRKVNAEVAEWQTRRIQNPLSARV